MTLTMRDSTNVASIPTDQSTDIACGYLTGGFANWDELQIRFAGKDTPLVSIDTNGSNPNAAVRDWETGDKEGSLHDWIVAHNNISHAAGKPSDAVVYCNRSTIGEVRTLTAELILNVDYYLWVATLDGSIYGPSNLAGVIACQDLGSPPEPGYDQSVVWPNVNIWWSDGIITNPTPPPPPAGGLPSFWTYGPVRAAGAHGLLDNWGPHSVSIKWNAPNVSVPAGLSLPGIGSYQIGITPGANINGPNGLGPFVVAKGTNPQSFQAGGLTPSTQYTIGCRAMDANGQHGSPWVTGTFTTTAG